MTKDKKPKGEEFPSSIGLTCGCSVLAPPDWDRKKPDSKIQERLEKEHACPNPRTDAKRGKS